MAPTGTDGAEDLKPGENPRFLLMYRAPQAWGLPIGISAAVAPVGFFAIALTGNWLFALLLVLTILAIAWVMTADDPNAIRVMRLWTATRFLRANALSWGGVSQTPLPLTRPMSRKQVPTHV